MISATTQLVTYLTLMTDVRVLLCLTQDYGWHSVPCMTQVPELGIGEVARQIGVSTSTLRRYVRLGKVEAVVLPSGHFRFTKEQVQAILQPAGPQSDRPGE
ncbi:MerR family transcriptional regulator [Rarobacter faecitabidus]|uniref:MerR family transcriptional regulator n=1 Tax=Rarobacter faecitabidus TaxID=13243 RepID=UPI003CCC7002